jgi:phage gp29-like protein
MANEPVPSTADLKREIVSQDVLYLHQYTTWRLALAFTGMSDPTAMWQQMVMDTPFAVQFYRELEEKDEDVSAAVEELKLAVLDRTFTVQPADESGLAIDVAAFVQAQIEGLPNFEGTLENLLDAPFYGFSLVELMFDMSEGQVVLTDAKDCPQELFTFALPFYPQTGNLRLLSTPYDLSGQEVPEKKFMIWSHRPRSRNRRGRPLLRKVFWPSWFKRQAMRFWLRFAEKGPGTAVVQYEQGASDSEKQKALAAAEAIIERVAIAVPKNFGLMEDLLKIARSQDPDVYEKLCMRCELAIYRNLVGETLTSHGGENGKGTQALGTVHETVKEKKAVHLAKALEHVLNDQLVKNLVLWNYGPDAPMPKAVLSKAEESDLNDRIQVDKTAQSMGMPITQRYVQETYGLPEVKPDDVVLTPAATLSNLAAAGADTSADDNDGDEGGDPAGTDDNDGDEGGKFSEGSGTRIMASELKDFTKLFRQLRTEASDIYASRIHDIASGMSAVAGAGQK